MNIQSHKHTSKSGAALVLVIGFLAILAIIILAFTAQTRTERITGRHYLDRAQGRHLLNTAMARAMEDIESEIAQQRNPAYPEFLALGSQTSTQAEEHLVDSINFTEEEAYIPGKSSAIHQEYTRIFKHDAQWQTVFDDSNAAVGRVGYIILNTSGQLDANSVGGYETGSDLAYAERKNGRSPDEIQLSPALLPELNTANVPLIREDGSTTLVSDSALALIYNRDQAWQRFENLRDFYMLNQTAYYDAIAHNILIKQPENFRTFSYFPTTSEQNVQVMGATLETLNETAVLNALNESGISGGNAEFVLQQLKDYLDADSNITDQRYSVEALPLLNEVLFTVDFSLTPQILEDDVDPENPLDEVETTITVFVTNTCSLAIESWMPFNNATFDESFRAQIDFMESTLGPEDLFPDLLDEWTSNPGGSDLVFFSEMSEKDHLYEALYTAQKEVGELEQDAFLSLMEELSGGLEQVTIRNYTDQKDRSSEAFDIATRMEFPLAIYSNQVAEMTEFIFTEEGASDVLSSPDGYTNLVFKIGLGCIDPRLNWDGLNTNHWVETGDTGYAESIGEINQEIIADNTDHLHEDEPRETIYVRNENQIDSPYEFTYFLSSTNRPWHTIQFFPELDQDANGVDLNHRNIAALLTTENRVPGSRGFINPNTPNQRVLASAFLHMPVDQFITDHFASTRRLTTDQSLNLFQHFLSNQPFNDRTDVIESLSYTNVDAVIEGTTWENESVLRNALDLLATRDSTFTLLLAAESGVDADGDGIITAAESGARQQAVAEIWRDPETGKAACTFFGLSNTLQSGLDWNEILNAFDPET